MGESLRKTLRWIGRWSLRTVNAAVVLVLLVALLGRIIRDRNLLFAYMMYIPLLPVGAVAVLTDALQRGRTVRRLRFGVLAVGAVAMLSGLFTLAHFGSRAPAAASDLRLLQWNTQWGGEERSQESWSHTEEPILERKPDIVIFAEAPDDQLMEDLCGRLGDGWKFVAHNEFRFNPHHYIRVIAASRWPMKREAVATFPHGGGMVVRFDAPGRSWRVLVVDGISRPGIVRTPFLKAVAAYCIDAAAAGRPIDLVAGDFNAVGTSIGFDDLREAGYSRASDACRGWIGTYPSMCPFYDIDHIWLTETLSLRECEMFSSPTTNHRGQFVIVR